MEYLCYGSSVPLEELAGQREPATDVRRGRPTTSNKHLIAIAAGVAGSVFFIMLSLRQIDLSALWLTLRTSHWWPWYVFAPVIYMTGHFARGLRCRLILRPHCEISTWTATNVVIIGYAANNVLPARMGEVVRAYVLSRKANVSISLSFAITLLERVLDGLLITLIFVVAGAFAPPTQLGTRLLWIATLIFATATAAIVCVMLARGFVVRCVERATTWLPAAFRQRLLSILTRGIAATDCLRDLRLIAPIVLLSAMVWLIEGSMLLLLLPAFDLPMNPLWAFMALAITSLGILVPSSPGYIGPFHFFCMQALLIFGVTPEAALGFAIMAHLLAYIPLTLWGLAAFAAYGVDLGAAVRSADTAAEGAPAWADEIAGAG